MATTVTVTGKLVDHSRETFPPDMEVELWFRPDSSHILSSMIAGVESKATYDADFGNFTVDLVSDGDALSYIPFMRWLASDSSLPPAQRAMGYVEFPRIWPDTGGDIGDLTRPSTGWVWVSERAALANGRIRAEFQYNPVTTSLYRRVLS